MIRELIAKTDKVLPSEDWKIHYPFFARAGFTPAAQKNAKEANALLVNLADIDRDLLAALNLVQR